MADWRGTVVAADILVIYVPVLQSAFHTVALTLADWLDATAVSATLLAIVELAKLVLRRVAGGRDRSRGTRGPTRLRPEGCFRHVLTWSASGQSRLEAGQTTLYLNSG